MESGKGLPDLSREGAQLVGVEDQPYFHQIRLTDSSDKASKAREARRTENQLNQLDGFLHETSKSTQYFHRPLSTSA